MRIEAQFFSRLRALVPGGRLELELPEGATVGSLLERLYAEYPALSKWDAHLLIAVGLEYAGRDQALADGDQVSIMPPVQGG